jgi:DNA ligase (NAD+)
VNAACPAQLIRNLEHFVSRGAMDIGGLGIRIVEKLIETGKVRDAADLYTLSRADILEAVTRKERKTTKEPPGKLADNLLASIEASREQPLSRMITALGIRAVGDVAAHDLAEAFGDLDALAAASFDELQMVDGVGPHVAQAVVDWFARPANRHILQKFKAAGVWPRATESAARKDGKLAGLTFVVTGTLPNWTREQAKEFIESNGGKVTDSVSKSTGYLVLGENPGSKLQKAQKLGVKIIGEQELRELAG